MNKTNFANIGFVTAVLVFLIVVLFTCFSWWELNKCLAFCYVKPEPNSQCKLCLEIKEVHIKWAAILGQAFSAVVVYMLSSQLYSLYLNRNK